MITILMTPTDSATEMKEELRKWYAKHHCKPSLIVGHRDLAYGLVTEPKYRGQGAKTWYDGIPVLSLAELWSLHADQFGEVEKGADE